MIAKMSPMSKAKSILQGQFGRVALLNMDRSLVPHAHRACHILFKTGGADTAFDVNGRTCLLTDQTAVLVNAWEQHAYTHVASSQISEILALYIDPAWLASIDPHLIVSGHAEFFSTPNVEISPALRERVVEVAARMAGIDPLDTQLAQRIVFGLTIQIMDEFSNRSKLIGEHRSLIASDFRVRKAIRWLRQHVAEPLDVSGMAVTAGLSRSHLFDRFKHVTGLTPAMFLNTLRMEAAHSLIAETQQSLIHIGQDLGFSEQGNFSRFFREHQGVTPSEYRRTATRLE